MGKTCTWSYLGARRTHLHDDALADAYGRGREGVAERELLAVPYRHRRVLAEPHVAPRAEVEAERAERRVAVVAQRQEVLRRGQGWRVLLLLLKGGNPGDLAHFHGSNSLSAVSVLHHSRGQE